MGTDMGSEQRFETCDCGSTDGRHPIDCAVFRRHSSVSCRHCNAIRYGDTKASLLEHDADCPTLPENRRPWWRFWR